MQKQRYYNIDLIKVIALYFIVLIHNFNSNVNFMNDNSIETYLSFTIRLIIEGVPIFIFVNGFLLLNKDFDLKKHIKKIIKIFGLIIFWSVIYILLFSTIEGVSIDFKHVVSNVLTTNVANRYTGILWFLQNLICLYLIYPLLKLAYDKNKKIYNYIFSIIIFFSVGVNFIGLLLQFITSIFKMYNLSVWVDSFLNNYNPFSNIYFILYFMLGGYVYDNIEKVKKHRNKILITALIGNFLIVMYGICYSKILGYFYSANFNYSTVFLLIFVIGLYAITFDYKGENKLLSKIITFCGKNSLGIYFIHIIVTKVLELYFSFSSLWKTLLYGILILVISSILTYGISKIPYLNKLIKI